MSSSNLIRTFIEPSIPSTISAYPQRDIPGYVKLLSGLFPEEQAGIQGLVDDMGAFAGDLMRYMGAGGKVEMNRVPTEFPALYKNAGKTWGQMVDGRIKDQKLKTLVSSLWVYYGLPPSRLSSYYYALPTFGYLRTGGYYPKGRSQTISDALVKFIESKGGKVLLKTKVEAILNKGRGCDRRPSLQRPGIPRPRSRVECQCDGNDGLVAG